jgi:hypothetical protein
MSVILNPNAVKILHKSVAILNWQLVYADEIVVKVVIAIFNNCNFL